MGTLRAPPRGAAGTARIPGVPPPDCRRRREPPSDADTRFRETADRARSSARPTSPPLARHPNVGTHRRERSARGHGRRRAHAVSPPPTPPPRRARRAAVPAMRPARLRPFPSPSRLPQAPLPPRAPHLPPRRRRPNFLRAGRAGSTPKAPVKASASSMPRSASTPRSLLASTVNALSQVAGAVLRPRVPPRARPAVPVFPARPPGRRTGCAPAAPQSAPRRSPLRRSRRRRDPQGRPSAATR